jgi:hypothetical protein
VSPVRYELAFYIPEDRVHHSQCRKYFKSYVYFCLTSNTRITKSAMRIVMAGGW